MEGEGVVTVEFEPGFFFRFKAWEARPEDFVTNCFDDREYAWPVLKFSILQVDRKDRDSRLRLFSLCTLSVRPNQLRHYMKQVISRYPGLHSSDQITQPCADQFSARIEEIVRDSNSDPNSTKKIVFVLERVGWPTSSYFVPRLPLDYVPDRELSDSGEEEEEPSYVGGYPYPPGEGPPPVVRAPPDPAYFNIGAKAECIEELEKMRVEVKEEDGCAICWGDMEEGAEVTRMPCSHYFHSGCLLGWLNVGHICPVCRFSLPSVYDE